MLRSEQKWFFHLSRQEPSSERSAPSLDRTGPKAGVLFSVRSRRCLLPICSSPLPVRRVSLRPATDTLFLRSSSESRFFDAGAIRVKTFQVAVPRILWSIRLSLSVFLTSSACPLTRDDRDLVTEIPGVGPTCHIRLQPS